MKFDRENIKIAKMLKFFASPEKLAFWRYALLILRRRYDISQGFITLKLHILGLTSHLFPLSQNYFAGSHLYAILHRQQRYSLLFTTILHRQQRYSLTLAIYEVVSDSILWGTHCPALVSGSRRFFRNDCSQT